MALTSIIVISWCLRRFWQILVQTNKRIFQWIDCFFYLVQSFLGDYGQLQSFVHLDRLSKHFFANRHWVLEVNFRNHWLPNTWTVIVLGAIQIQKLEHVCFQRILRKKRYFALIDLNGWLHFSSTQLILRHCSLVKNRLPTLCCSKCSRRVLYLFNELYKTVVFSPNVDLLLFGLDFLY